MSSSFSQRCVCGALIATVTFGGLVYIHDQHTHVDSPASNPVATQTVSASSSGASTGYGVGPYGTTGYGL